MIARLIERDSGDSRTARSAALDRDGGLVLVEGPAGVGRSLLLEHTRREARERGMTVFAARAASSSRRSRSASCASSSSARCWARRPTAVPSCSRAPPRWPRPRVGFDGGAAPPVDAPFSVLHGIYWLAANLACEQPVLLAVDDAHWADAPSLRALAYLAARLDGLPVTIVVTVRSGERALDARLLDELARRRARRPAPRAAQPGGDRRAARGATGAAPTAELVAAAERATGGNPFLLEELRPRGAPSRDRDDDRAAQLARAEPPRCRRSSAVRPAPRREPAAARGRAVPRRPRRAAPCRRPRGRATRSRPAPSEALVAAGFLRPGRPLAFAQTMVRACVLRGHDRGRARRSCTRAPPRCCATPGCAPTCSRRTCSPPSPPRDAEVVRLLRAAAARVLRRARPDLARDYLRRALREPPAAGRAGRRAERARRGGVVRAATTSRPRPSTSPRRSRAREDPALRPGPRAGAASGRLRLGAARRGLRPARARDRAARRRREPRGRAGAWRPRWPRSACSAPRP